VIRVATDNASPFFVAAIRAVLGVVVLFGVLAISRR
jgi:hypothetical protein